MEPPNLQAEDGFTGSPAIARFEESRESERLGTGA